MPNRVIRGDILRSTSLARVSEAAELLFEKLLKAADDYGRYEADPEILAAQLYPRRPDVTGVIVAARLLELATADMNDPDCPEDGPVLLYKVGRRAYLWLVNWERHRSNSKRGSESRWPLPPTIPNGLDPPKDWVATQESTGPQDAPGPPGPRSQQRAPARGVGESGSRGVGESRKEEDTISPPAAGAGGSDPPSVLPSPRESKPPDLITTEDIRAGWTAFRNAFALYGKNLNESATESQARTVQTRLAYMQRNYPEPWSVLGPEMIEGLVHGYVLSNGLEIRDGFDGRAYLTPKTLLRPSHTDEYIGAWVEVQQYGLSPPYTRGQHLGDRTHETNRSGNGGGLEAAGRGHLERIKARRAAERSNDRGGIAALER